jgi:hypothetical protein
MPLIQSNYEVMHSSEIYGKSPNDAATMRFRINCEFLYSCEFQCGGCYVNRTNNFDERQLDILAHTVNLIREQDMIFDEIILGPTDAFGATNTAELLDNPTFHNLFSSGDVVLTLLSTLQSDEAKILEVIEAVNRNLTHPDQEIEALIVFDVQKVMDGDILYTQQLKRGIALLDKLNARVDYALQMNIQDTSKLTGEFNMESIAKYSRREFNAIVEFNPSFLRTRKPHIVDGILNKWNDTLREQISEENRDWITFTMANTYHAGFNEITYNFHDGDLYFCPFIYENVFDRSEPFKLTKSAGEFYNWSDIEEQEYAVKADQFSYLPETTECADCEYQMSCVSKHVQFYMKHYGLTDCIIAKDVVEIYS